MSCAKYLPLISKFLDGEASSEERAEVENHIVACGRCRAAHDEWQAEGAALRGFFRKNMLDEGFVRNVRAAAEARAHRGPRRWIGANAFRWAQAIAAVAVLAFLATQFFPSVERSGLATVLNPGDGLEIRPSGGKTWTSTTVGAVLRAGDWIRNAERTAAQILLLGTAHVTLNSGAVAQIGSGETDSAAELSLVQGTVASEEVSGRELQVRTAAAVVTASNAQFDVHVEGIVVPKLVISEDASEVLSGEALPVAGVMVASGSVRLKGTGTSRDISAGETAYFSPAQLSVVSQNPAVPRVVASLDVRSPSDADRTGQLHATLVPADGGLQMRVRAENIPLKRLLESTTGERVSGAADLRVTGDVAYSVESSDEEIVEGIGNELGVVISVADHGPTVKTASISEHKIQLVSELAPRSEFTVSKSPEGLISFGFRGVAAGQVFQALQSVSNDVPLLSVRDQWIPVTLEASRLMPQEIGPWLERELGLVTSETGSEVRVVQVGGLESPAMTSVQGAPAPGSASTFAAASEPLAQDAGAAGMDPARRFRTVPSSGWWMPRPFVAPPLPPTLVLPGASATGRRDSAAASSASSTSATATGRISAHDRYAGSRHLIWPALVSADPSTAYVISNPWSTHSVTTIWKGYDASGQLVAVHEAVLDPSGTLSLSPLRDLPDCGENGHWETYSDYRVCSITDGGSAVPAVEAEELPDEWEFDLAQLGVNERLWFANPTESGARIVLALVRGNEVVSSEQIILGPHAAATWTAESPGSGFVLVANVKEGSMAAGVLRAADQPGWHRDRSGEPVH